MEIKGLRHCCEKRQAFQAQEATNQLGSKTQMTQSRGQRSCWEGQVETPEARPPWVPNRAGSVTAAGTGLRDKGQVLTVSCTSPRSPEVTVGLARCPKTHARSRRCAEGPVPGPCPCPTRGGTVSLSTAPLCPPGTPATGQSRVRAGSSPQALAAASPPDMPPTSPLCEHGSGPQWGAEGEGSRSAR